MSTLSRGRWEPPPGAYGPRRRRRPCDYAAYVPDRLTDVPLTLPSRVLTGVSDAERALAAVDGSSRAIPDFEALSRFLLRAEAVASSKIEHLVVGPRRLARHEAARESGEPVSDATADAILGNIAAMRLAVQVGADGHLDVDTLLRVHAELLKASDPELAGQVRTAQNWIGGNDHNPCGAEFVPPPPDHVDALLEDLCAFARRDDVPPLLQAALVHAQFETIHPFTDGNGRTGRALIHVVLRRRGVTTSFTPPISLVLATRTREYVAGLTAYRYDGDPGSTAALEGIATWVDTFSDAALQAAADASDLADQLQTIEQRWRERARPRRGSAADRLLRHLLAHPIVSAESVAKLTGASRSAAFAAVHQLREAKVLAQVGSGKRLRLFEARDVLDLLTDVERSLAAPDGDTRHADPVRPVPARRKQR